MLKVLTGVPCKHHQTFRSSQFNLVRGTVQGSCSDLISLHTFTNSLFKIHRNQPELSKMGVPVQPIQQSTVPSFRITNDVRMTDEFVSRTEELRYRYRTVQ